MISGGTRIESGLSDLAVEEDGDLPDPGGD
jgi:hypothetical protein